MGLAVGPRARVPVSHNRRVTNVLLIAPPANGDGQTRRRTGERERLAVMRDDGSTGRGIVAISRPAGNNAGGRQDAAPGSGEYAFWITGGCPRRGVASRCVCRSVRDLFG